MQTQRNKKMLPSEPTYHPTNTISKKQEDATIRDNKTGFIESKEMRSNLGCRRESLQELKFLTAREKDLEVW